MGWEKPARIPGWAPARRGAPGRRACSGRCRAPEEPHLQPRRVSAGSAPPRLARPGVCRSGRSPVPGEGTLTLDPGSGAPYSDPEPHRVSPGPHLLPRNPFPLPFFGVVSSLFTHFLRLGPGGSTPALIRSALARPVPRGIEPQANLRRDARESTDESLCRAGNGNRLLPRSEWHA